MLFDYLYTPSKHYRHLKLQLQILSLCSTANIHTHTLMYTYMYICMNIYTYIHTHTVSLHNLVPSFCPRVSREPATHHFPGLAPVISTIHLSHWRQHNCGLLSAPGSQGFRNCYLSGERFGERFTEMMSSPHPKAQTTRKTHGPPLRNRPATGSTGVATLPKIKSAESRSPLPVPAKGAALVSG